MVSEPLSIDFQVDDLLHVTVSCEAAFKVRAEPDVPLALDISMEPGGWFQGGWFTGDFFG